MSGRGTPRRWDGDEFVPGGTIRRWTGTEWRPKPGQLQAEGGLIADLGAYRIHTFLSTADFVVSKAGDLEYLIIGGGGAGSGGTAGGGGAGDFRTNEGGTLFHVEPGLYSLIVGAGGLRAASTQAQGHSGVASSGFGITALGGGAGANTAFGTDHIDALGGGSGGGGCEYSGLRGNPGISVSGFGFPGAIGPDYGGGGGGGAGGPGVGRDGGVGRYSSISGFYKQYAGGGGGSANDSSAGAGGAGGGGYGAAAAAGDGSPNTGSGGGGGWFYANGEGGNGGGGIIIVRYLL